MPSRARWLRIRWTQARSSSAERALASDSMRCRCADLDQVGDRLLADPLGRRVRRDQLRVGRLDRLQLVEQRVVLVVADLRVIEHVVPVRVVVEQLAQLGARARRRAGESRCSWLLSTGSSSSRSRSRLGQRLHAVVVGQVEVQRRERHTPRRDRGDVGVGLLLVASWPLRRRRGSAGGWEDSAPLRPAQLVAVEALAQSRNLDALRRAAGKVDVEQRARPAAARSRDRATSRAVKAAAASKSKRWRRRKSSSSAARLLRDGDPGHAEHDRLERGRDRARVGDVVTDVRAVVDAGDDQLRLPVVDQAEVRQPHAVDRCPVGCEAGRPITEVDLLHPQRPAGRDHASHRRAVPIGRDHPQIDARHHQQSTPQTSAARRPRSRRRW